MRLSVVQFLQLTHVRPLEVRRQHGINPQGSHVKEGGYEAPQLQLQDRRLPLQRQDSRPLVVVQDAQEHSQSNANLCCVFGQRGESSNRKKGRRGWDGRQAMNDSKEEKMGLSCDTTYIEKKKKQKNTAVKGRVIFLSIRLMRFIAVTAYPCSPSHTFK